MNELDPKAIAREVTRNAQRNSKAPLAERDIVRIARTVLTDLELQVWLAKHVSCRGRRSGSLALGITEDAWRHRLQQADRKILQELEAR